MEGAGVVVKRAGVVVERADVVLEGGWGRLGGMNSSDW